MVGSVAIDADVVCRAVIMVAKAELVVSRIQVAIAGNQFALMLAFKTGARDYVKDAIGAVAVFAE